jgi:hypothetical protein
MVVALQAEFIFIFFVTLLLLPIYQCEEVKNAKDDYDKNAEKDELILVQAVGTIMKISIYNTDQISLIPKLESVPRSLKKW